MRNKQQDSRKFERPETFLQNYINHLVNASDRMFTRKDIALHNRSHTLQKLTELIKELRVDSLDEENSDWALINIYTNNGDPSMAKACFLTQYFSHIWQALEYFETDYEFLVCQTSSAMKAADNMALNSPVCDTSKNYDTGDYFFTTIEEPETLREFFINDLLRTALLEYNYGIDLEINSDLNLSKLIDEYGFVTIKLAPRSEKQLNYALLFIAESEKINGDLSLIGKNEKQFESLFKKYSSDKGLKQLLALLDNLIDECDDFENVRKHGVADLHRAKARSSLKRAVNAYYNFQAQANELEEVASGGIEYWLGRNPATGMAYFTPYLRPKTIHEHFINNIIHDAKILQISGTKGVYDGKQIGEDETLENSMSSCYLYAVAEAEKEKFINAPLRGHLGTINDIVKNNPLEQAQHQVFNLMQQILASHRGTQLQLTKDKFSSVITKSMRQAIDAVIENKQIELIPKHPKRLQLILNRN